MITTVELSKKTGLSSKTLGRWVQQGILSAPHLGLHPSGRGKSGLWPDSTIEFCRRVTELRKQGASLQDAAETATFERLESASQELEAESRELYQGDKSLRLPDGTEVDLIDLLRAQIAREIHSSILGTSAKRRFLRALEKREFISAAISEINAGQNIYFVFDGERVHQRPDYLLHEAVTAFGPAAKTCFELVVTPLFGEVLKSIGMARFIPQRQMFPAHKVWTREGDLFVEYAYFNTGSGRVQRVAGTDRRIIGRITPTGEIVFIEGPDSGDK